MITYAANAVADGHTGDKEVCNLKQASVCSKGEGSKQGCFLKKQCSKSSKTDCPFCPLVQKFMKKYCFIKQNYDVLGLTENQMHTLKKLKMSVKRSVIDQEANYKYLILDIKTGLYEHPVNTKALHKTIDDGLDKMKNPMKDIVNAYAKMKGLLTDEQWNLLKKLCREKFYKK